MTSFYFGRTSLNEINTIWPEGQQVLHRAMSFQLMDFGLPKDSGGRTNAQQEALYAIGRRGIKGERPVTWTLKSNHLIGPEGFGYAFDVVPFVNGRYVWQNKPCLELATVIFRAAMELGIGLEWGFHLWGKDLPHFQKKGLQS